MSMATLSGGLLTSRWHLWDIFGAHPPELIVRESLH